MGLKRIAMMLGIVALWLSAGSTARADNWSRYYHWPAGQRGQNYYTPYEYERVYDGRYRYPMTQRWYPQIGHYRNWIAVKKRYYRGYHFILDQF